MESKTLPALYYRLLFPKRDEKYYEAKVEKISYGGILLRTNRSIDIGTLIEITTARKPGAEEKLKLLGEVKWKKDSEKGDDFTIGVFYLLPTPQAMWQLFRIRNVSELRRIDRKLKK